MSEEEHEPQYPKRGSVASNPTQQAPPPEAEPAEQEQPGPSSSQPDSGGATPEPPTPTATPTATAEPPSASAAPPTLLGSTMALGKALGKAAVTAVAAEVKDPKISMAAVEKGSQLLQGAKTKGGELIDDVRHSQAYAWAKEDMSHYCTSLAVTLDNAATKISSPGGAGGGSPQSGVQSGVNYTLQDVFQTGNVVQLISRSTEGTVQIVDEGEGGEHDVQLAVNALGPLDPSASHTLWMVTVANPEEEPSVVQLSNQGNYLGLVGDEVRLVCVGLSQSPGVATKFEALETPSHLLQLQSVAEAGCHVGFAVNGEVKSVREGKSPEAQFGVKLVKKL